MRVVLPCGLLACGGGDEAAGVRARSDYAAAAAGDFYAAPFPDVGRSVADVQAMPAPRAPEIVATLKAIATEAPGFATTSTVYFAFEGALAPIALEPTETVDLDAPVLLVDLDADPPRPLPVEVRYRDEGGPFGAPFLLSILPLQGVPMIPGRRHAAVVTRALRDLSGAPIAVSEALRALRRGARPEGLSADAAEALREADETLEALGVEAAALATFTPADPTPPMRALRDAIVQERPALVRPFALLETHPGFCVFASELPMPVYQRGEPPFTREGGDVAFDEAGRPIRTGEELARVFVTLPRTPMPASGFPTLVFSRTGGGGDRPLIDRGVRDASGVPIEAGSGPARELAAVGFAGVTFPVAPGMTVLWHAIAGGVGLIAAQWLSHLGVTVIGTTSSESKAALAMEHGATHVIDYTREDVVARVRELTEGHGVPVVYDSVGRSTFDVSLGCLARRGMLVGFGNASGAPAPFDPMILAQRGSLFYTRASLFDYVVTRAELLESASKVFGVMGRGVLKVHVGQSFRLDEARACHEALESRGTRGATVLVP